MKASVPLSLLLLLFVALCPISGYTQAINNRELLLDMMSGVANYLATTQDEHGAIIDPFLNKEHQYSTPYFAAGVACLVDEDHGYGCPA